MLLSGIEGTNGAAGEAFPGKFGGFKPKDSPQAGAENLLSGVFYMYFPFKKYKVYIGFLGLVFPDPQLQHFVFIGFFFTKNRFENILLQNFKCVLDKKKVFKILMNFN